MIFGSAMPQESTTWSGVEGPEEDVHPRDPCKCTRYSFMFQASPNF
jgi:hypothetical protein